jgi:DNA-binding GntR family transcriptional regulator
VLRRRIQSGELAPGARLPSVASLMSEYGVARNTAAKALRMLADEGLVEIVPGWGSFVTGGQQSGT